MLFFPLRGSRPPNAIIVLPSNHTVPSVIHARTVLPLGTMVPEGDKDWDGVLTAYE